MQRVVFVIKTRGGWIVEAEDRLVSSHRTETVAIERAWKLAKKVRGRLVVRSRYRIPVPRARGAR